MLIEFTDLDGSPFMLNSKDVSHVCRVRGSIGGCGCSIRLTADMGDTYSTYESYDSVKIKLVAADVAETTQARLDRCST